MKPRLTFLSDDDLTRIHESALHILSRIGMQFPSPAAIDILTDFGAELLGNQVVRIPPALVAQTLATVPKRQQVVLYGRDPVHDFVFAQHGPTLACMTMAVSVIDLDTGQKRPANTTDLERLTRLADTLPHIGINGGLVTPQEVPGAVNDWYSWAATLKNTTKHLTGGVYQARGVRDAVAMASLLVGSEAEFHRRPFISGWILTLPPLAIDAASLEALLEMARLKVPAMISSGPIMGTTSPVTIAGTMAQAHAEILGCLVVTQLVNPGAPVVYTSFARGFDMKTASVSMACPEFAILKAGMAQLGRWLDLPVRMPGMLRDAKILDAQAGFETGMVAALTGISADIMDGMQLDMDLVVDYADLVFCNEAMGALKRLTRDLVVNDETLALPVITEIGPRGHYLAHGHTYRNFRRELWQPTVFERHNWEGWAASGAKDIRQVCLDQAKLTISQPVEPMVTPEITAAMETIVARARSDYGA